METLSSIILDDDPEQSQLLLECLSCYDFLNVISIENKARLALSKILFHRPKLVFLEVETPELDGFEMIRLFKENNYYPKVILTSAQKQYGIKAIRNGVFDYLLKPFDNNIIENFVKRLTIQSHLPSRLSNIEKQIITYLTEGCSSKEIATNMNLSTPTISYHKTKILKKYKVKTTAQLLIKV